MLKQAQQIGILVDSWSIIITNLDAHTIDLEPYQYGGANITTLRLVDATSAYLTDYGEFMKKMANDEQKKNDGEENGGEENGGAGDEEPKNEENPDEGADEPAAPEDGEENAEGSEDNKEEEEEKEDDEEKAEENEAAEEDENGKYKCLCIDRQ